jgi:hypothetical protein
VKTFLSASDDSILFCGMAIGYADKNSKINELSTSRRSVDEWANFIK